MINSSNGSPFSDPAAWEILRQFASTEITLREAEEKLMMHFGNRYSDADWHPALKAVMDAEGDVLKAHNSLREFSEICERPKLVIKLPAHPPQIVTAEENLLKSVEVLKARNRVFGAVPSIEELVDSKEENQALEDSPLAFPGGDHDIVEQVVHEGQVKRGEIKEGDSEE